MKEHDIFPIIFDRLRVSQKTEYASRLLYSLTNLCTKHASNQDEFRLAGGIPLLLGFFQSELHEESLRADASTTLWAASLANEETLQVLCQEETFAMLQQCLVMETEKVLVGVVATLGNIASFSDANRAMLRHKCIIPLILDFLRGSHSPLIETAAGTIMSFIRGDDGMFSV